MSTAAGVPKSSTSPNAKAKAKEKEKEKRQKGESKPQTERLKVVVRRLPPNLPEDIFWQSVQQWVTEDTVQWKEYYKGKFRTRINKENIPSRAYIAFKNEEQLAIFSRDYDGHIFRDKAGNESIAIVEFAPFQKFPVEKKKKPDSKIGTIEKEEDFQSFLRSLEEGASKPADGDTLETLIAASQPPPQPTTTPLLEALKAEKSAQKDKEAILRAHAHYKDPAVAASAKKDDKKKGAAKSAWAEQPVSKKAKKAAAKAAQQAQAQTQNQQPVASTSTQGAKGNSPANAQQAKQAPATPKAPRAQRERQAKNPPTAAPVSPAAPSAGPSAQPASDTSVSAPGEAAAAAQPSRRRPVLGLGSRQFEAALSGAGVSGRAQRRGQDQTNPAADKEKGKDKSTGGVQSAPIEQSSKAKAVPPPTILTRDTGPAPKILAREGGLPDGASQDELKEGTSSRGGRRGRGRGRGGPRGGAPAGA